MCGFEVLEIDAAAPNAVQQLAAATVAAAASEGGREGANTVVLVDATCLSSGTFVDALAALVSRGLGVEHLDSETRKRYIAACVADAGSGASWQQLCSSVRAHLRVVLLVPLHDTRVHVALRSAPGLFACTTTIDYFEPWGHAAFAAIARARLERASSTDVQENVDAVVNVVVSIHVRHALAHDA